MTPTRTERRTVPASEVAAHVADGWRVVFALPQPARGTDVLMERVWREVVVPASGGGTP